MVARSKAELQAAAVAVEAQQETVEAREDVAMKDLQESKERGEGNSVSDWETDWASEGEETESAELTLAPSSPLEEVKGMEEGKEGEEGKDGKGQRRPHRRPHQQQPQQPRVSQQHQRVSQRVSQQPK